ncbi:biotin--[acetyl-CoA-carboxylase] ligase [Nocardioides yefusunii]|uniref:biotin--[biotin carboxyl-carrier protein] ligase n=1 Tax=Nocardioides yefusunii TaxID=2500546 RepID=A0ABW1QXZ1_9ACTN|nr:biotin--[acetyl-CoA-carboxylase] ligase [Nocardioides yefusunii]
MEEVPAPRPALDPDHFLEMPHPLRVEVVDETPSTNADVVARAKAGEPEGLVIAAEHQTSGRGRLDRAWEVPRGGAVTFSILLRPSIPTPNWTLIPLLAGVAVQAALADRLPEVTLKWPNDVLYEGRKLCGILVERVETPEGPAAVIGIGINVNQTRAELPVPTATSLLAEIGESFDRNQVLEQVLGSIRALLPLLEDAEVLRAVYADTCSTIGQVVDVHLPGGETVRGEVLDIDTHGALVMSTGEGTFTAHAGDVVHVRPAS